MTPFPVRPAGTRLSLSGSGLRLAGALSISLGLAFALGPASAFGAAFFDSSFDGDGRLRVQDGGDEEFYAAAQ